jgi:hypothetical protein
MDINLILQNNDNLRPRDEVRIENLAATPYPDGRRVQVEVMITPFRERPNLDIVIISSAGQPVAMISAIAIMQFRITFNLHLRGVDQTAGDYTVRAQLYYEDAQTPHDTRTVALNIPAQTPDSESNPK